LAARKRYGATRCNVSQAEVGHKKFLCQLSTPKQKPSPSRLRLLGRAMVDHRSLRSRSSPTSPDQKLHVCHRRLLMELHFGRSRPNRPGRNSSQTPGMALGRQGPGKPLLRSGSARQAAPRRRRRCPVTRGGPTPRGRAKAAGAEAWLRPPRSAPFRPAPNSLSRLHHGQTGGRPRDRRARAPAPSPAVPDGEPAAAASPRLAGAFAVRRAGGAPARRRGRGGS